MSQQIEIGDIVVDVLKKDIKNIHLGVYPPFGRVRISAPQRMSLDMIRIFTITKMGWIKSQQVKITAQERETPREYIDRESHFVWGKRYLLVVKEGSKNPAVEIKHDRIILNVSDDADAEKKREVIEGWYRQQIKETVPSLIAKWEFLLGVRVARFFVQRMKTKWGGCNYHERTIRLNTELARKPKEYLEYVIVHEAAHLLVPTHNAQFIALMDQVMPNWRFYREQLNQLPVAYEDRR